MGLPCEREIELGLPEWERREWRRRAPVVRRRVEKERRGLNQSQREEKVFDEIWALALALLSFSPS